MRTAVVIPCYKVRRHILDVVQGVLPIVDRVYVIDDCCPEESGALVLAEIRDPKLKVIMHEENQGVGGAVVTGYRAVLSEGFDVAVKMDGDGQMDPAYLAALIRPILAGEADYTKGNRFFSIDYLRGMPKARLFGNSVLSLINKISSGYWNVMDPTNGFTAIHASALSWLPLAKLSKRYFFESDMLFRLGTIRAVVKDVPIPARYADEISQLRIRRVILDFPLLYFGTMVKRFFYNYILRDLNVGTLHALIGLLLFGFGTIFGAIKWVSALQTGEATPIGTVMLTSLPIILGVQFLIAALSFDIQNVPTEPIQRHWYKRELLSRVGDSSWHVEIAGGAGAPRDQ
jgi:dolichol-phosphate mannosyltransferase